MGKIIKIAFILLTFTVQSVLAASAHCSMDMSSMDMSSMEMSSDINADMHAAMGHSDMEHSDMGDTTSDVKQSMDCCDSINECPTGTCSAPALSDTFANVLLIDSNSAVSTEYRRQIQTSQTNLFRPPILA